MHVFLPMYMYIYAYIIEGSLEVKLPTTPLLREANFEVKMYKTPQGRTTFGSADVEKVHAVVARSTF